MKARNPSELLKNKLRSMMEKRSDTCSRNRRTYLLPYDTHVHTPEIHNTWQQFSLQLPRHNTEKGVYYKIINSLWRSTIVFWLFVHHRKDLHILTASGPLTQVSSQQPPPPAECTSQKAWIRPSALMWILHFILKFENTTKFPRSSKEKSETK